MKDLRFDPVEVTVKQGGTITWTNDDSVRHTVTKESGPGLQFDSGNVEGGGIFEQRFTEAGKISYLCQIHRVRRAQSPLSSRRRVGRPQRRRPKPRSVSSAASPSPPRSGSRPSWVAAS